MPKKPETTSKRVRSEAAWLLRNMNKIIAGIKACAGSALTQSPDKPKKARKA